MSTTSPTTGTTPPAAPAQNTNHPVKPRQAGETGADLFSSLLSLLASTTLPATDDTTGPGASRQDDPGKDPAGNPTAADNPLAGLLASLPGWTPAGMNALETARGSNTARPGSPDGALPLTAEARALMQPPEPGAARERGTELRPERGLPTDKARQSMAAAAAAAMVNGTEHRGMARGAEQAPGMTWVRAAGAPEPGAGALLAPRSTVALDERFAGAPGTAWGAIAQREAALDDDIRPGEAIGLRTAASAEGSSGGIGQAGAGGATTGDGSLAGDTGQGGGQNGSEARSDDSGQGMPAAPDDTEVTHWGAGHVRHASLRVGGDGEQAIDIRLQMQGQEVQIGFATDDAQARELLREQAPQVLGELLERSGVALGGVSVGAQGQPGQNAGSDASARLATAERAGRSERADAPAAPVATPVRPRTDGSRPLDVFA
ncbi:flagellar hook-length control protein FliK [uncultured Hydrogenophaga sp.]|uniref:flagellar hook-length control protein FliK n=1 Tax=uncultured Hydrogenophaga sp. TaxID=199683 RepID=UPI00265DD3BD|nr:flagellar hook-length control protein FliK [uncultured Hydrogenophaga sp.]